MEFRFDANQEFQGRAIEAVADLFDGQTRVYLKLPYWFTVPTPVGEYRPDWAIVMDGPRADGKPMLYLVAETKDPPDPEKLRPDERRKVLCGAAHFGSKQFGKEGALDGVDYKVVACASKLA